VGLTPVYNPKPFLCKGRTPKMYQNFIGIDIGKRTFVVGQHGQKATREFENTPLGFQAFYQDYENILYTSLVVLETTGGYEMALLQYLLSKAIAVHRADTRKVKYFIRSLGKEAKSDSIDSLGLARYGYERHERLELFVAKVFSQDQLQQLAQRRLDLKQILVQEKNRSQAPRQNPWILQSCLEMINALEIQLKTLDNEIKALINADAQYKAKQQVLIEVDGIGTIISSALLALLPELGTVNRRQIASLIGVAPHPSESGQKIGYRRTKGGRQDVRSILFMAAMTASRSKGRLGDFYRQLVARGKKKMVALVALMRKIIVIANAKLLDWNRLQEGIVNNA
jgi:transposase